MTVSPVFGLLIGADDVADAVLATLRRWMPAYLAETARQAGLDAGTFPDIRSWDVMPTIAPQPEHRPPALIVVPEQLRTITDDGTGKLAGQFLTSVVLTVASTEFAPAVRLIGRYTKATAAVLVQQPLQDIPVTAVTLQAISWDARRRQNRHIGTGVVTVGVHVAGVIDPAAGPDVVPADPTADPVAPPTAIAAHATVTNHR